MRLEPDALRRLLLQRSRTLQTIREFLTDRGVLEVETPLRYPSTSSEPCLHSFPVDAGFFLQTSPEFPMKRLLSQGSGPIFQICKAFRWGEAGRQHNPEFTMLEWYQPGFDCEHLMDEIRDLVSAVCGKPVSTVCASYRQWFFGVTGLDCDRATDAELRDLALAELDFDAELDRSGLLDLLFSGLVEPTLDPAKLSFVTDYPEVLAELSEVRAGGDGRARALRFEAFLGGMELANGCVELADPARFRARWNRNNQRRLAQGLAEIPEDQELVAGLANMPPVAGAALGVDRLIMSLMEAHCIQDVLAFPEPLLQGWRTPDLKPV